MAGARAGVGERPAGLGDEAPVVARRLQRQLEHPEGVAVGDLAVGDRGPDRVVAAAAGPDDELAKAGGGVERSRGGLGSEALVVVVVRVEDDVGAGLVERLPQRLDGADL